MSAVRLGLFLGGFSGLYKFVSEVLELLRNKHDGLNSFIGGLVAGISLTAIHKDRCECLVSLMDVPDALCCSRRTIALYLMARVAQCCYNACKARGWWHLWGSDWRHGDALLFIVSSAQVM